MLAWRLGARDAANAHAFIRDVQERVANRIQLTTDGNRTYLDAVLDTFAEIDFAQLVKLYGNGDGEGPERSYSPAKCNGAKKKVVMGHPDENEISTSYAERQNLNIRMQNRRYTRLTNAFSKKFEMLEYSVAISFFYHNFVRIHQTLRMTPAMKAGVTAHNWSIEEMVDLLPEVTHPHRSRGTN
jgi:IS1 family transposase